MPEVNQYALNNKELLELLIKHLGVHEGRWLLMVNFGIAPGNYGPALDQLAPGVAFGVNKVGIQRADPNVPKEITMDAALVNPAPKSASQRKKS